MIINAISLDTDEFEQLDKLFEAWLTYQGRDPLRGELAVARYDFVLKQAQKGYLGIQRYFIKVVPKGTGHRTEKENGVITLNQPIPKGALEGYYLDAVKTDTALVYRGMAWEEWRWIQKHGVIKSFGTYNLGQEGLTLWGEDFSTAAHYASGFAPWPFKPSFDRPSMIISIPKTFTLGPLQHGEVPTGERATLGSLDSSAIQAAWMLIPSEVVGGTIEGEIERRMPQRFEVTYTNNPSSYVHVVPYKI